MTEQQVWDEYQIHVPDKDALSAHYETLNKKTLSILKGQLDIAYGTAGPRHCLDIFAPETAGSFPIVVFIHGGYWRFNSKELRRFPAQAFIKNGIAWVPINYRLSPEASIDDIVHDVRAAIAWLYQNAKTYHCDPERIYVCGNSAGGHLVAMLSAAGWQETFSLPDNVIKGGCALSGLFDLEPLLLSEPNEWLQMDKDTAIRNSPVYSLAMSHQKLIITCGTEETNEFRRQSRDYAERLKEHGVQTSYFEMEGENHFSIIGRLADEDSELFKQIVEMVRETES